ncbi:hypothetical protein EVAR_21587_1 [Eumeta japonica]|uniref:Uncharacterized protein n=1 Tax=Eumeta variegata TaxID=151549 RepID=A0A4C1UXZ4_EUMVA|nr:hypothetical protein EVAR_21587_1 [Eumeta japonica]
MISDKRLISVSLRQHNAVTSCSVRTGGDVSPMYSAGVTSSLRHLLQITFETFDPAKMCFTEKIRPPKPLYLSGSAGVLPGGPGKRRRELCDVSAKSTHPRPVVPIATEGFK